MSMEHSTVTLPSRGLLNDIQKGKVTLRNTTISEEKLLLSKMGPGAKIISVLSKCITEPEGLGEKVKELAITDLLYLFFELRKLSIDPIYELRCVCTLCQRNFTEKVRLPDDLQIRYVGGGSGSEGPEEEPVIEEPWTVDLDNGDTLKVRYLRGYDMLDLERLLKSRQVSGIDPGDDGYVERMARHIVSVNDEKKSPVAMLAYLQGLSSKSSNIIKDSMEGRDFGAGLMVTTECTQCGFMDEEMIRLSPEFFRPRAKKNRSVL